MTDQKSDKQKPREFWIESMIRCWSEDGLAILKHSEDVERIKSESIHVVEVYALEAALAELEKVQQDKDSNDRDYFKKSRELQARDARILALRGALKLYSDQSIPVCCESGDEQVAWMALEADDLVAK